MNFRLLITIVTATSFALISCEGVVHMQGYVMDSETNKPIKDAQILLVQNGKDTLRNIKYTYDTLSYHERIALRKNGVKDDFNKLAIGGFSKNPTSSATDTSGFFTVGKILVGCIPKCPSYQLVFIKEGYEQFVLNLTSIVHDSIKIFLGKIPDKSK